ncbi:MAG TPA: EthD domain-containing protein [Rhizomicrobium sp.]|nr:EthD domain-containing protein [Rhizomicrobium sp.]
MIKLTFCLKRLPHLSREAFQTYWFEKHAPLVAKHREVLRIRRYVQMHSGSDEMNAAIAASRGAPEMFDGVAELWWDSFEDIATNVSAEAQAAGLALLEDERKFIDLPRSPLFFGEEKTIFG